jgi:ATP-dependent Clp endopeptidase proteolytic subunit ClpP
VSVSTSRPKAIALAPQEIALLEAEKRQVEVETAKAEIELRRMQDEDRDNAARSSVVRHLWVNDVIGGSNSDIWLHALQVWDRRDPGKALTVDINSPGGSITDGLALYDQLMRMRRAGTPVTTRATGLCASMAAVLLQAGETRLMDTRAKLLIHEGSATFGGTLTVGEQEDFRTFSAMLQSDLLDILSERSTLSKRQIQTKWKRKDWYLTAPEALKLGFVDAVE